MHARESARPHPPSDVSLEIVSSHNHVALIKKRDIDELAIRDWRARSETVEHVFPLERRSYYSFLPKRFSRLAVQTKERALLLVEQGRHQKQPIFPNNRRSVADPRNFGLPNDVARGTP